MLLDSIMSDRSQEETKHQGNVDGGKREGRMEGRKEGRSRMCANGPGRCLWSAVGVDERRHCTVPSTHSRLAELTRRAPWRRSGAKPGTQPGAQNTQNARGASRQSIAAEAASSCVVAGPQSGTRHWRRASRIPRYKDQRSRGAGGYSCIAIQVQWVHLATTRFLRARSVDWCAAGGARTRNSGDFHLILVVVEVCRRSPRSVSARFRWTDSPRVACK